MARALWTGSISFGLVQIPVGLHVAERSKDSLTFTLLDAKDHSPVGYRHVNKSTGEEVPKERRIKGYEVKKGEYVILTDQDFKAANPKATETIDIVRFVDAGEIPPTRFEKPYYLAPQKKGLKAYALLREALVNTNKVALASLVLRQRQHLCAVMPYEDGLLLEILRYDYEVVPIEDADVVTDELKHVQLNAAEIKMAEMLVEGMAGSFDTSDVKDTYHDDLLALIKEREEHPERVAEPPKKPEQKADVVDIMTLLKRSVEQHAEAPRKRAPHRSAARKKTAKRAQHG